MPADGVIVAHGDDPDVLDVVRDAPCAVHTYGVDRPGMLSGAEWRGVDPVVDASGTRFHIVHANEGTLTSCGIRQAGLFNALNALAAVGVARALGVPSAEAALALAEFRGVKRRMELRGVARGTLIVDDFAHHPTAVTGTVEAARARFGKRKLIAVLEPRTNTSRRAIFQQDYARAFGPADCVVVRRVGDEAIYSATGDVAERFSADELVRALHAEGKRAIALGEVGEIVDFLCDEAERGYVILVMSNGSFDGLFDELIASLGGLDPGGLEALLEEERVGDARRVAEGLRRRDAAGR